MKISWADYTGSSLDDEADAAGTEEALVWHYTSAEVFQLVVENNVIWATDINHLNDTDEIRLGIKRFGKALKAREASVFSPKDQLEDEGLVDLRRLVKEWKNYPLDGSAFTVSFSRYGDDNSQWERYAKNATGVAVGIRRESYMPVLGDEPAVGSSRGVIEDVPLYWTKMLYKRRKQQEAIEYAFSEMLDGLSRNPFPDDDIDMSDLIRDQAISVYSRAAASIKNPGFRSEKEYRYVVSRPNNPRAIHARPHDGVPFVKITGAPADVDADPRYRDLYQATPLKLPIEAVRIGPKSPQTSKEMKDLLESNGYADVRVEISKSTLR